jgi:hypothetical protein
MPWIRAQTPAACPVCGGSHHVRVLWDYSHLTSEQAEAVANDRALLGLSHRYFTSVLSTPRVAKEMHLEPSRLPRWACLSCSPRWREFHRLALSELEAAVSKFAAFDGGDFERAAALLHAQEVLEIEHATDFERLLIQLVGPGTVDKRLSDKPVDP